MSPFSALYGLINKWRNRAFDRGLLQSYRAGVPTIAVGNLSVGGTGKTPMIEFLIRALNLKPKAVVSRGYGRKTKGLLKVDPRGSAEDFGDESLQIAQKFPLDIWVSEARKLGVQAAEAAGAKLILLDDAYQHRYVKADRYLLLSRFDNPFFSDFLLPGGSLRESRQGAQRAHFIIFTKCPPQLSSEVKDHYRQEAARYSQARVLFAHFEYGPICNQFGEELQATKPLVLISAIANNSHLQKHLQKHFELKEVLSFKDHHHFSAEELKPLKESLKKESINLVCTDKDRVKLGPLLGELPLYSVPVAHHFNEADQRLLISDLQGLISP